MVGSFPLELSKVIGMDMILLLRVKEYNQSLPNSSIAVIQYSVDLDLIQAFEYLLSLPFPPSVTRSSTVSPIVVDESAGIKETELHNTTKSVPKNHSPKRKER